MTEYGAPAPILEFAWGADLSASHLSWAWTDESDRLVPQTFTIKRGRADEASRTQPSSVGFELDNRDGALTPEDPRSAYYPDVVRGTPCRVRLPGATTPYMALDGTDASYASSPDVAHFDISNYLTLWFDADIEWDALGQHMLIRKYETASDERSYALYLYNRTFVLAWSTDGTLAGAKVATPVGIPWASGRHAVAIDFDTDNGAGGWTAQFYTADTGDGPWEALGDPITEAGVTSIYNSTAPLVIGGTTGATTETPIAGKVYEAGVKAGSLAFGIVRANPDFTLQTVGATSFNDTAPTTPKAWTLQGDAAIVDLDDRRTRFFGQVDEIVPSWPYGDLSDPDDPDAEPGEARVSINASGMLRRLGQGNKSLDSTLYRGITRTAARAQLVGTASIPAYWSMEDGRESASFASPIVGCAPMGVGPGMDLSADSSFLSSRALPRSTSTIAFSGLVPPYTPLGDSQTRIDFFVYIATPETSPAFTHLVGIDTTGTVRHWTLSVNDTTVQVLARDINGATLFTDTYASDARMFDTWTLWSFNISQDLDVVDYDWNAVVIPDGFGFGDSNGITGDAGRVTGVHNWLTDAPPDGITFGHFVVSTGLDLGWLAGRDTAWVGESAAHRYHRLCTEEGIAVRVIGDPNPGGTFRGDTSLSAAMGPQLPKSLLDLLQECVDVDLGTHVEERDRLGLVFRTGQSLYNQTAKLALDASTRTVDDLVVSDIVNPFVPSLDDQRIRNDITVTREGGSSFRVTTDPPPPPDDRYDEDVPVNIEADVHLPGQAGWRLHLGAWPGMRYPSVTTDLAAAPHLVEEWLDADLLDRVTVDNLPPQHPVDTVDLLAEGYDESFAPDRWDVTIGCSPGGPWRVGVREDATEPARYDAVGSVLENAYDAGTDTSFDVVVGPGAWTTAGGDFPFDVNVGGARVTVTAIGALSGGVQTFTCTAATGNGVARTYLPGTAVSLWQPAIRAL